MKFKEAVTYDDMLLVPQYSDITTRKEVDIGSDLSFGFRLGLPIIASPMDTVSEVADDVYGDGTTLEDLAVIHRYNYHPRAGAVWLAKATELIRGSENSLPSPQQSGSRVTT